MQNEDKNIFVWSVNVGSFDHKKIGRLIDEKVHFAFDSHFVDVSEDVQ
jgi:hypothetical protein